MKHNYDTPTFPVISAMYVGFVHTIHFSVGRMYGTNDFK